MSTVKTTNIQHGSAASPAIVLSADGSATAELSSINSGPLAGFRNAIINGNFDIWQRGTSFSATDSETYICDRWLYYKDVGGTLDITRESFTLGQTDVPGEPTYFLRFDQSVGGSGGTRNDLIQRIEGVRTFAGQEVTLSFYAKSTSPLLYPR